MILTIVGKTASGKTTLAKSLEEDGYERIITCTTREKRENEIDGEDYFFISKKEYADLSKADKLLFQSSYGESKDAIFFGTLKDDIMDAANKDKVIILDPLGVEQLLDFSFGKRLDVFVTWLDLPEETLVKRAISRGESADSISKRLIADNERFIHFAYDKLWDLRIYDELSTIKLKEHIRRSLEFVQTVKSVL